MTRITIRVFIVFGLVLLLTIGILESKTERPKIYISVDMEGIGAIVNSAQTSSSQFEYGKGRKLMTAED